MRLTLKSLGLVALALAGASLTARSVVVVASGEVAVPVLFGAVRPAVLPEGPHLVNPLASHPRLTVRRQMLEMSSGGGAAAASGGGEVVAVSAEGLALAVDVGFPVALSPAMAWKAYQRIGGDGRLLDGLVRPAARAAVRDGAARFGWEEASADRRAELAAAVGEAFASALRADLERLGFTAEEARRTFLVLPVQLRRVLPPPEIQQAVAEKLRARQDLERQQTLTQIARIEVERRENEGLGVARLFGQLPQGFTPEQIAVVLGAIAGKTRAEAMARAAEGDKVRVVIMEGGAPAVLAPGPEDP